MSIQDLLAGFLSLGLACTTAHAAEGMWPYEDIHYDRVKSDIGVTLPPEIIDHLRLASLTQTDGCSYSFVSPNGLILTNQHCVQDCLRSASRDGEDLIRNGFAAATMDSERRCSGTRVSQLIQIEDVTDIVRKQVDGSSDDYYVSKLSVQKNILESGCATQSNIECALISRYGGLKFFLYHYKVYRDLRIAFAPEQSISFFGEENVNYVFDVAFLRAYDDNGRPVDTSGFRLKFCSRPPAEGDAVLVSGNPYYTRRYMLEPESLDERDATLSHFLYNAELRGLLGQLRLGDAAAGLASDPILFITNLTYANNSRMFDDLIHRAPMDAAARTTNLAKSVESVLDLKKQFDGVILKANLLRGGWPTTYYRYMLLEQGSYSFLSEYFQMAKDLVRVAQETLLPDSGRLPEYVSFRLPDVVSRISADKPVNKQLEISLMSFSLKRLAELGEGYGLTKVRDQALRGFTPASAAEALVSGTQVGNRAFREELYRGGATAVQASQDPMIAFVRDVIDPAARQARRNYSDYIAVKAEYQRSYYGILAKTSLPVAYPDADGTLRLSYGSIKGIARSNMPALTKIQEVFNLDGSRWNYQLPQTWKTAKGDLDLGTTLSFIADSDTIGGNSGSAVVNIQGELVGLVWGGSEHGSTYYRYDANDRSLIISAISIGSVLRSVYKLDRIAHEISD